MIERRQEPRARTLLGGKIVFDDHNRSMDCTLRNLGPHGALAQHSETFRIPPEFDLMIPHREEAHRARASLRWKPPPRESASRDGKSGSRARGARSGSLSCWAIEAVQGRAYPNSCDELGTRPPK